MIMNKRPILVRCSEEDFGRYVYVLGFNGKVFMNDVIYFESPVTGDVVAKAVYQGLIPDYYVWNGKFENYDPKIEQAEIERFVTEIREAFKD